MGWVYQVWGREVHRGLVEIPDLTKSLGRPKLRRGNNIKMDNEEVGLGNILDRTVSGEGQVGGACECGNEHSDSIKNGEFFEYLRTC
jgi:hypothetical protein